MKATKRFAATALTMALAAGTLSAPALAASSTSHWSKSQCKSWQSSFVKRNSHASKARKALGNKVLSGHGCTQRIK